MFQFVDTVLLLLRHLPTPPPMSLPRLPLLPAASLSFCAVKTPFVYRSIQYLCSFGSTQLLIGVYLPFVVECTTNIFSSALFARFSLYWTMLLATHIHPLSLHAISHPDVILIFQFSTCLRRTTNKTKTKYRQLNGRMNNQLSLALASR